MDLLNEEREQIPKGTEINGFIFLEKIGKGGYSDVYKVKSKKFDLQFVAKVMFLKTDTVMQSIESEIGSLKMLDHPNIIRLYDHFYYNNNKMFIIILELCQNGSLMDEYKKNGPITGPRLITISRQIIDAVAYAHSMNIAHRDIKPQNILFDDFGRPKLADFGIAHIIDTDSNKVTNNFKCSLRYAAPEVLEKREHDDYKADVWSLGMTLATISSEEPPIPIENVQMMVDAIRLGNIQLPSYVPFTFTLLLKKMLELDPLKRISMNEANQFKMNIVESTQSCDLPPYQSSDINNVLPHLRGKRRGRLPSLSPNKSGVFGQRNVGRIGLGSFRSSIIGSPGKPLTLKPTFV